jgi:indole-3-glycerol phosphate synthase
MLPAGASPSRKGPLWRRSQWTRDARALCSTGLYDGRGIRQRSRPVAPTNSATVLGRILAAKREEVAARRRERPATVLREAPTYAEARRGFRRALAVHQGRTIIAELKRASPSRGRLRPGADAVAIGRAYAKAGAAAISVLTDQPFFQGTLADLEATRRGVELPVLRKDFFIDVYQVEEARAAGADAMLLIVAATEASQRQELLAAAATLGLDVLVEVHDERELESALEEGATLVGINNRDLRTLVTTLATSERLLPSIPESVIAVCESGLRTAAEMARLEARGARAFLVGEALMEAPDPAARLREFLGG